MKSRSTAFHATNGKVHVSSKLTHVAFLITRADTVGGAHIHVRDLCEALMARGIRVTIIVGGVGPYTNLLRQHGIPFISLQWLRRNINPLRDVRAILEVRATLKRLSPDLISLHSSKAGLLGRVVCRWLSIPVIFTAHGWSFTEGINQKVAKVYEIAERLTGTFANRIITVSEYDKLLAEQRNVLDGSTMKVVHNGMPDFDQDMIANPSLCPPRLLMVARMDRQKDHGVLLSALSELRDLKWSLNLIGDGPERSMLEPWISEVGLTDRVKILGLRNDVAEQLSHAQVFVLTSNWEGFPRSILEAMRAGLPVVASDVGGVSESVIHGATGFLVPPGDKPSLRDALREIIENPQLRARLGDAGRVRYEQNFTFEHMFSKTLAVYEEVLHQSGQT